MFILKKITAIILTLVSLFSILAFPASAANAESELTEEVQAVEFVTGLYDTVEGVQPLATGLIIGNTIRLTKTSSGLEIKATTKAISEVTKCGFTYIKLQRWLNGRWADHLTFSYTDQYSNSNSMTFTKIATPEKGHTYRVVCEHYAEKRKLLILKDKEKIYNETASVVY